MARISDHAHFCHQCGLKIGPIEVPTEATDRCCPECGYRQTLEDRILDDDRLKALECPTCAGLWLDREIFDHLVEKARVAALSFEPTLGVDRPEARPSSKTVYRRCPHCRVPMTRREFSRGSRVVVDTCHLHGTWFDPQELSNALRWIREGGERHARDRAAEDAYDREKNRRHKQRLQGALDGTHAGRTGLDFIPDVPTMKSEGGMLSSPIISPRARRPEMPKNVEARPERFVAASPVTVSRPRSTDIVTFVGAGVLIVLVDVVLLALEVFGTFLWSSDGNGLPARPGFLDPVETIFLVFGFPGYLFGGVSLILPINFVAWGVAAVVLRRWYDAGMPTGFARN